MRFFDIFFCLLAIIFLLPLLIFVVVLLKFTGEGEIFFTQTRIGRNGKVFNLYKFATMLKNSPNMATGTITIKDDPRVLPIGKLLRRTKINELPQLINVLNGDMSLIGPRPMTSQTFGAYSKKCQETLKSVRPGLSGIGSIFFRNEENILINMESSVEFYNDVIAPYKGALEEWYVENRSMGLYFKLIFLTFLVVLFPSSKRFWLSFQRLPTTPEELKFFVNY